MQKIGWERASGGGQIRGGKQRIVECTNFLAMLFYLFTFTLLITGCGGGGGAEGVSSKVVSGVAATGDPLSGQVMLKDASGHEKSTVIAGDGTFALDVTGMEEPFALKADGTSKGTHYTLYSFAEGPGIANVNPLADAVVANAAEVDDPATVYDNPDKGSFERIKQRIRTSTDDFKNKIRPLLHRYDAEDDDPISGDYKANHTRLDRMFDDVIITRSKGILTITNKETGAIIYQGPVKDFKRGHFTDNDDDLPNPNPAPDQGTVPVAPVGAAALGGDGQVTVSWDPVSGATSYNIYWSDLPGVDTSNGLKISNATSPFTQTGLDALTTYYYIVTAVNSAGEGFASAEVSAITNAVTPPPPEPTVPAAPAGVSATGGNNQVTILWSTVADAASYNLYWSVTSGVTKDNGTKITGVTSPVVHSSLADNTTYYYVVTAVNSVGESADSVQVAATTLTPVPAPTVPDAPTGLAATGGANQVSLSWNAAAGAASYNLYWSTTSGVTPSNGTMITGVTSPYVHTGRNAGTTYYYIVTAVNGVGESTPSAQAGATTNAPPPAVPAAPTGVAATGGAKQITVSWGNVSGASSYNVYWSTSSGVSPSAGTAVTGVTSPFTQTGLADGTTYYYVVTALNGVGESLPSAQVSATTSAATPPPTPALCVSCHGTPPASGAHAFHFPRRATCSDCHAAGYDPYGTTASQPAIHMNGVINIATGNPPGWNATNRTCSNSCHSTKSW